MKKLFFIVSLLYSKFIRAFQGLKQLTDPAIEGNPYRTNRLGRRGGFI